MGDNTEAVQHIQSPRSKVVVTGFGPFGNHYVNASWLAVQELEKLGLREDIELITFEIPVKYASVKTILPELWEKHNPMLMIHVGVSGIAKSLTFEQQAHNDGYDKYDVDNCHPDSECCIEGGDQCLVSQIDMNRVVEAVNNSTKCSVQSIVSTDPGRYLCDFSFYTSLHINRSCSAFIHVPPIAKPYSALQLAEGIKVGILDMLEQLNTTCECD
ncbi:unnamed protein product [Owenia fusiformis]|uniref:Uncharacterized protein n=1 Tax=Owenia fusiformis TaxID=6347 RepID=A0A8J1XV08_OWEFU|nr:unnamed protein product [Owenia fusiformis]